MHIHVELVVEVANLEERTIEAALEPVLDETEWEIGGRFRGAHEPGGPYPSLDVEERTLGGLITRTTAGRTNEAAFRPFAMARNLDVIRIGSPESLRYLSSGREPLRWLRATDNGAIDTDKASVVELANERAVSGLALITLDLHE